MILYAREIHFSCAHFYEQPQWTPEQNKEIFGLCYSKFGHGHEYRLKVEIEYQQDQLELLKSGLQQLQKELDHKHLNFEFEEFKTKVPTTENLLQFCYERLWTLCPGISFTKLSLWETPFIRAEKVPVEILIA